LLRISFNEIVANFDQHVGTLLFDRMTINAVTVQMASVGFVFAHAQIRFFTQTVDQGDGQAAVSFMQNGNMPRSGRAPAKLGRIRMHRNDHSVILARGQLGKSVVIRAMKGLDPAVSLSVIGVAVARDNRAVIKFHQQGWVIFAAVWINHKAREIRQNRRRIKQL
jgi:uncharacterized membrane protein YciS (DUF1049 family)